MDPVTIITVVGELANVAAQYQAGQLTPEQLVAAWNSAVDRVKAANDAWEASKGAQNGTATFQQST